MSEKDPIKHLIVLLARLPGLGEKSSARIVYHLLSEKPSLAKEIASALITLSRQIKKCSICGDFSTQDPCKICSDETRDHSTIMVVEEPQDMQAVEKTKKYNGLYHILGGSLSPLSGRGPEDLRIKELLERLKGGRVKELIIATNPQAEGEATANYLAELVKDFGVKLTRLARGIPVGTNLEYLDPESLSLAISGRKEWV